MKVHMLDLERKNCIIIVAFCCLNTITVAGLNVQLVGVNYHRTHFGYLVWVSYSPTVLLSPILNLRS